MTIFLSSPSNPAKEENRSKHCGLSKQHYTSFIYFILIPCSSQGNILTVYS